MVNYNYEDLVDFITTKSSFKPPRELFKDEDNWECKTLLARLLMREEQYEPAFEILKSAAEGIDYIQDIDQKVWVLRDLGVLYWILKKDAQSGLINVNKALEFVESTNHVFTYSVRGEIWKNRLNLLRHMGKLEDAQQECRAKMSFAKDMKGIYGVNSYLFYGYLFMAENEKNLPKALEYLKQAADLLPNSENLPKTESSDDVKTQYEKLYNHLLREIKGEVIDYDKDSIEKLNGFTAE